MNSVNVKVMRRLTMYLFKCHFFVKRSLGCSPKQCGFFFVGYKQPKVRHN